MVPLSLHPTFPPLGMFSGEPAVTVFAITWQKSRQRLNAARNREVRRCHDFCSLKAQQKPRQPVGQESSFSSNALGEIQTHVVKDMGGETNEG